MTVKKNFAVSPPCNGEAVFSVIVGRAFCGILLPAPGDVFKVIKYFTDRHRSAYLL
jgi:hypothetical protein